MKTGTKILSALLSLMLLVMLTSAVGAQDDDLPGPGEGGIIIEATFSGINTGNPITCGDTVCRLIDRLTRPGLIAIDPATELPVTSEDEAGSGGMAESWEVSEDGTTYTFNLRDDLFWSDGTPVTAQDYFYTWEAILSGEVETSLGFVTETIQSVETPDDYTVVVTFAEPDCTTFSYAGYIPPVPVHIMPEEFSAVNDLDMESGYDVFSGPFVFGEASPSRVSLLPFQDWVDSSIGFIRPEGFIYRTVPDQTVLVEQFLAGETNVITGPAVERRSDIRALAQSGDVQMYEYPGRSWDYMGLNLADPENPVDGLDENGEIQDQGHHPVLGDVRVRQAFAHAINVDAIIEGAVFGEADRMTSALKPSSWAYNEDLPPIPFDPEMAATMLEEAGWVDSDGDGIREATEDALYAEPGTPLAFTLYTNEGNSRRTAVGTIIQDQLAQVGVDVDFQTIDFFTLLDIIDAQTFDAYILGWSSAYPDDPDLTQLFSSAGDVVGAGSNAVSYNNPEFNELNRQARTIDGCAREDRAPIYHEMQEILQDDMPYIWLYTIRGMDAARSTVNGFDPFPVRPYWNIETWSVSAE